MDEEAYLLGALLRMEALFFETARTADQQLPLLEMMAGTQIRREDGVMNGFESGAWHDPIASTIHHPSRPYHRAMKHRKVTTSLTRV